VDVICCLDVESTGMSPAEHQVIELGVVSYSIKSSAVLGCYSELIELEPGRESNEAEAVISTSALALGRKAATVWARAAAIAGPCEAILAHNAEFDRSWVPEKALVFSVMPWIDTCFGVNWPKQSKEGSSLINLALEHGLGVVDPHRALQDCLLIARLMTRCAELGHDVSKILERGLRPMATYQAMVSYDTNKLAKEAGFKWKPETKQWLRRMAIEDAGKLGFQTVEVK
jgi:DNA polymerase-3 subunit epsilon